jgi:NAD(P)-dependent dehydrogenase (short-subunit alcohol dehydrogenase family)
MPLNGKVALVTGAGSGVGRAAASALQRAGWHVALAGRRPEAIAGTASEASADGGRMVCIPADVSQPDSVTALFTGIEREFGRLDVLFNNAGVNAPGVPFEELAYDTWKTVIDVNLTGAFLCAQAAFRMMKNQEPRGGRIINNGSVSAYAPRPNQVPYTAAKHAITGLTKCLVLDGRKYDIACSQIDIGNAATEMTQRMTGGVLQANGTVIAEPRMDVHNVADAVPFMANLPLDANVTFMTIMATAMPLYGRG